MKSFIAILALACAASASVLQHRAVCDARHNFGCPSEGVMGCEKNGGHSMRCGGKNGVGQNNWQYATNCPDRNAHCDCNTGLCVTNGGA